MKTMKYAFLVVVLLVLFVPVGFSQEFSCDHLDPPPVDNVYAIDETDFFGTLTGFVSPFGQTAFVSIDLYLDFDGILYLQNVNAFAGVTAARWKRNCAFSGTGSPPNTSISAQVTGDYFCLANIVPSIINTDEVTASTEFVVQANCTNVAGNLVDRKNAVQVDDGSLSISVGTSGTGFNWTPSGTGNTASTLGLFPASGASNFDDFDAYFTEGFVSLLQAKVNLSGHDEDGYAEGASFVSLK